MMMEVLSHPPEPAETVIGPAFGVAPGPVPFAFKPGLPIADQFAQQAVQLPQFLFSQRAENFLGHVNTFIANILQHIFSFFGQIDVNGPFVRFVGAASDPARSFQFAQQLAYGG